MRNYPAFPRATPHQWAGSPRVPHPSATFAPEGTTFDLHALGTPPALILSQDQTLHQLLACPFRKKRQDFVFHFTRASSRCARSPQKVTPPVRSRRVGPPSSAARTEVLGAAPGPRSWFPSPVARAPHRFRQPTCQCAGHLLHHAETPPSFRGPLNLPCLQNGCQGGIKRKFEVIFRLDSIRNGRRLDARCARVISYYLAPENARNYSSTASGVEEPVPTRMVFSEAP
jgi:hypothetical protein